MRKLVALLACFAFTGCGNSAIDGEAIGQAKKLTNVTPIICPNYMAFDLSLGVMRNGSGSISAQDIWLTVEGYQPLEVLKKAVEQGSIVKVRYNSRRMAICTEDYILTAAELVP